MRDRAATMRSRAADWSSSSRTEAATPSAAGMERELANRLKLEGQEAARKRDLVDLTAPDLVDLT